MTCWARFMQLRSGSLPCKSFPLTTQKNVNWVLFIPLQIQSSEECVLHTEDLASTYADVCCWWVGPWHAVICIFHPNCIKPVFFASGSHPAGNSLPIAEVCMLPLPGQVTQVQTEGAVAETPMSLSPRLPHARPPVMSVYSCIGCVHVTSSVWPCLSHLCFCSCPSNSWYMFTPGIK